MRRFKRGALLVLALLLLCAVLVAATAWWLLRGSLPALDGELAVRGLAAPVSIERDALGVVTIDAASQADAMRSLGYVHAQERYFEMDLMRRTAAGELAALFGAVALETDRKRRVHRMRARVSEHLDTILGEQRAMAQAYVDGVNAGLADLDTRPWPYLLLRAEPEPWQLADSALTGYAMYFDLQDARNARELALWRMRPHLPPALFALLTHDGSRWDAPLIGAARGDAVLPDAGQVDLRTLPAPRDADLPALPPPPVTGSNNFAVAGALTRDGRAIVADDMHLGLRAPNIWFRARLRYPDPRAPGGHVDASGFTLPGLPAVVVGSNGHVAWGFTNSYGDFLDWQLQPACDAQGRACPAITTTREIIEVAGAEDVVLPVQETRWGPILHREPDGSTLALRWAAHLPSSLTLGLSEFMHAGSLDQALQAADGAGIPTQNLVIGDSNGRIAWRLLGPLPQHTESCPRGQLVAGTPPEHAPAERAPPAHASLQPDVDPPCEPWSLTTSDSPALVDPPSGRLWTANNRVVGGEMLERIGDGGYALGARAAQIRNGLFAERLFDEGDLLAIQLDDRALFLQRWWMLLHAQAEASPTPALRALAAAAQDWQGRAAVDATSYRLVRAWRLNVHERIADGLTAPAQVALGDGFEMPALAQLEGVAWPLVTQQPAHLLPRRFASWEALFEDAAQALHDELGGRGPLAERTWGERNTAHICHPLAGALPAFAKSALCMPDDPLPGDTHMPRVQGPGFGASQRMVVAPGHEDDGIAHMPGGQSGHPLSPFWGAGHEDWVHGRATPFLPGEPRHQLRLTPAK
ncbi:penicillin acylase family protein [Lysobacter sp. D1-1-M9]